MTSPGLWAGGVRFLGHPVPAADLGRPSEDRPAYWPGGQTPSGFPRSAPVETRRGWVPPIRRGPGAPACRGGIPGPDGGRGLVPGRLIVAAAIGCDDLSLRRLNGGSLAFTHPVFPSPGSPGWIGLALGFTRLLSHAALPGRWRGSGTDLGTGRGGGDSPPPLTWCDFVSHAPYVILAGHCPKMSSGIHVAAQVNLAGHSRCVSACRCWSRPILPSCGDLRDPLSERSLRGHGPRNEKPSATLQGLQPIDGMQQDSRELFKRGSAAPISGLNADNILARTISYGLAEPRRD
jgi:hypothetical protein